MSKNYRKKNTMKKVIAGIVAAVLGVGLIAGIVALTRPNTKDEKIQIKPSFSVGALDENGKYEKSESTLYTKDAFAAEGLEAQLTFDATISYQFFYYDEDVEFLSSSGVLNVNNVATLPEGAEYARVMIMPDWTGVDVVDQEIGLLDISKYTSQIKFLVNNPDYVEDEKTEEKLTELVIDTEHFGVYPSKTTFGEYADTYEVQPSYILSAESGGMSPKTVVCFKPMQLEAGKYAFCYANCSFMEGCKEASLYAGICAMYDNDGNFVSALDDQFFEDLTLSDDGFYTASWLQFTVTEDVANVVIAIANDYVPYFSIRPVK